MHRASGTTTATMAVPSLPASPTLTNPDMILPYGEYDPSASPPQDAYDEDDWIRSRQPDMQFSLGPPHGAMGPLTPTTPIIYGNGTMLSDIGEVTEAESTPSRKLPGPAERRLLKQQAQGASLRSSPTLGHQSILTKRSKIGAHERRQSIESVSTVTSEAHAALFRDFDDGVSVDDSVFQGDDEESVADSYTVEMIESETQRLSRRESDDVPGDRNSSAALSRRAEQILLNAKKRLNNMEGNLTRARSSLYITPSSSMSSIHSSSPLTRSTPSPPQSNQRIITQLGMPPSKHRQLNTPADSTLGSPGHARVNSENSVSPNLRQGSYPMRSASAAALYVGKGGFENNQRSPPLNQDFFRERSLPSPLSRNSSPRGLHLESLSEDDATPDSEIERPSARSSIDDSRSSGSSGHRGLTRSASSMQVRDLKGQMSDLKGRLSVLRDRARDDNMKRRSMQSLRTPSPFTAAEQWYTASKNYGDGALSADAGISQPTSPREAPAAVQYDMRSSCREQAPEYVASDATSVYEDVSEGRRSEELVRDEPQSQQQEDYVNIADEERQSEDADDDANTEYIEEMINPEELEEYESDASLYHDSRTTPVSHEDREDAFDYEHFFLHSAMGTISQQRRDRRSSFSSEDSVETTRGPTVQSSNSQRPINNHLRSESTDSISTIASFATATEGLGSENGDEGESDDFAVQQAPPSSRTTTPTTGKRSAFGTQENGISHDRQPTAEELSRLNSVIRNRGERSAAGQRPSIASFESFESTGTTRSFPLVSKSKRAKSQDIRPSGSILSQSPTLIEERLQSSPVHMLNIDDQVVVERLVASLGRCVLGLQEAAKGSYEERVWRRRLDAATRTLEGEEGAL